MSLASSVTEAERSEYLAYEQQRQRRLLGVIVPAGIGLTGVAVVVASVTLVVAPHQDVTLWVNDGLTFLLALLFIAAWLALRRDWLRLVAGIVIGAGGAGILTTVAVAGFSQGLAPLSFIQVGSLGTVLVMAGMLGGLRTILGATLVLNGVTLGILLLAPRSPALDALIRQQLPLLVSVTLTYQWAVATLMLAIWLTYRQTLRLLGNAYVRAQQLDSLKAQFITHINHELRTPIMTLQGYVEYLRLGRRTLPEAELDSALEKANRTADTLVALLSNILEVRRIEVHEVVALGPVHVREALDAALALIDPRVGDGKVRDLRLRLADDLGVYGNQLRLQQILTNLLSNALKYSPPGTPIEVAVHIVQQAPTSPPRSVLERLRHARTPAPRPLVEIVVRDYGQGIPPDQIPLLFNRFVRLPRDLASKVVGSGLGLYLCRVFAESMGGTIWVESTGLPGEGSTFFLRLPAVLGREAMESQVPPVPSIAT
jgi:signal transduction histidine kinase